MAHFLEQDNTPEAELRRGLVPLLVRQGMIVGVGLVTQLVATRLLSPVEFGYAAGAIVTLGVAKLFYNGGLAVYLVQRKMSPEPGEIAAVLALQMALFLLAECIVISLFLLGLISPEASLLLAVSLLAIPATLVRAAFVIDLERRMRFSTIARIDITEQLTGAGVLIGLLLYGIGFWAIPTAALLGIIVSTLVARKSAPLDWSIGWSLLRAPATWLGVRFGLWYMIPNLIGAVRSAALPIIIGGMVGAKEVGLADRAGFIAGLPLMLISGIQQKALFPFAARVQDNLPLLRNTLSGAIHYGAMLDKLLFLPLLLFPKEIFTLLLPPAWLECVPLLQVFLVGNILFGALASPTYPVLNGLGRSGFIAWMALATTVITWTLLPLMIRHFGLVGYAYNSLLLWFVLPFYYIAIQNLLGKISLAPMLRPLLAFSLTAIFVDTIRRNSPNLDLARADSLAFAIVLSELLYVIVLISVDQKGTASLWRTLRQVVGAART